MRSGGTHTASRTTALVIVQLLRERERLSAPGSTEDNTVLLKTSVLALIPLVTGLLVHAAARPVRRSHISTKLRPSLTRHAYGFILMVSPCLGLIRRAAPAPDQFVQGRPTPFFIVRSKTSDKLPKLNRVGMPKL